MTVEQYLFMSAYAFYQGDSCFWEWDWARGDDFPIILCIGPDIWYPRSLDPGDLAL